MKDCTLRPVPGSLGLQHVIDQDESILLRQGKVVMHDGLQPRLVVRLVDPFSVRERARPSPLERTGAVAARMSLTPSNDEQKCPSLVMLGDAQLVQNPPQMSTAFLPR